MRSAIIDRGISYGNTVPGNITKEEVEELPGLLQQGNIRQGAVLCVGLSSCLIPSGKQLQTMEAGGSLHRTQNDNANSEPPEEAFVTEGLEER